jgi:hypothetical protein
VIKAMLVRWVEHVASNGRREMHTEFWLENLKERDHLEDITINVQETGWEGIDWLYLV